MRRESGGRNLFGLVTSLLCKINSSEWRGGNWREWRVERVHLVSYKMNSNNTKGRQLQQEFAMPVATLEY